MQHTKPIKTKKGKAKFKSRRVNAGADSAPGGGLGGVYGGTPSPNMQGGISDLIAR